MFQQDVDNMSSDKATTAYQEQVRSMMSGPRMSRIPVRRTLTILKTESGELIN